MVDTRINEWMKLKFIVPANALPKLRKIQELLAISGLPDKVKNLRTSKLKRHREGWVATLFCYGMSKLLGTTVFVCPHEASDYDAVSMWHVEDTLHFAPIQIKEVVPQKLNPYTDINKEIVKLRRYSVSNDTIVIMHVNRPGRLDLSNIQVPKLNISQLWLLGASTPNRSKWFIGGSLLEKPKIFEFKYPV